MAHVRETRSDPWADEEDAAIKPLTREEVQALREKQPTLSPWRVIAAQAVLGAVVALLAVLITGQAMLAWSALWGAAVVVVPGALVARGMTRRVSGVSPVASAVSVMLWETVKIAVSVALLALAPKFVNPLSWPMLLAAAAGCLSVYWFALLWRGRKS